MNPSTTALEIDWTTQWQPARLRNCNATPESAETRTETVTSGAGKRWKQTQFTEALHVFNIHALTNHCSWFLLTLDKKTSFLISLSLGFDLERFWERFCVFGLSIRAGQQHVYLDTLLHVDGFVWTKQVQPADSPSIGPKNKEQMTKNPNKWKICIYNLNKKIQVS